MRYDGRAPLPVDREMALFPKLLDADVAVTYVHNIHTYEGDGFPVFFRTSLPVRSAQNGILQGSVILSGEL